MEETKTLDEKFSDVDNMIDSCAICLEGLTETKITECNHEFHEECLNIWLDKDNSCPLCRKTFDNVKEKDLTATFRAMFMHDIRM